MSNLERQGSDWQYRQSRGEVLSVISPVTYSEPAGRSADFQSAVSQNCILLSAARFEAAGVVPSPVDCKSAIQQIENLRYVTVFASQRTKPIRNQGPDSSVGAAGDAIAVANGRGPGDPEQNEKRRPLAESARRKRNRGSTTRAGAQSAVQLRPARPTPARSAQESGKDL